ncbi:LytTR family DNA-binding domain-containing protein [Flavobacteriaceae bacterium]|nr:LytTR family DNA-binding domain-containing protein [Flavobacteriaceae bacterium]
MMRSSKVSIYTLEFEPVTFEDFNKGQVKFISLKHNQLIIYISILAILILFSVFYFKKFYKKSNEDSYNYLFVRADRQNIKLFISDIWAVEALKDYIKIVCENKNYIVHNNLSKFVQKLPQEDFIQIHRSFVVNIEKITSIKGDLVYLEKKYYKVGGKYLEQLKGRFDLK